jgi:hypothetical protein
MKINRFIKSLASAACLFILIAQANPQTARSGFDWGIGIDKLRKALPPDKTETFTPKEKPKYTNKIMSYITAIDSALAEKIIILRHQSSPVIDYLFVNGRLYTIMEQYDSLSESEVKEIQTRLTGLYGQPQAQQEKDLTIYSYASDTTKALFYLKKTGNGKSKSRVYYYAKKLFRMLILE